MSNMSHCRFRNTLEDLRDCQSHMEDERLSPEEAEARNRLLRLCQQIANDFDCELEAMLERIKRS